MCARVGEISYGINSMRERIHDGNELPRWVHFESGRLLSTAFRNYRDIRQEPQRHKDTKKGRIKESFYCGLSLCLCVFVVLAYVTVFANNCT